MERHRVQRVRVRVDERWVDLGVDARSVLNHQPPGPAVVVPGARLGPGHWDVGPVTGIPAGIDQRASYEVAVTTSAGECWRGRVVFARLLSSATLLGQGAPERS
jgi:hypothetical protein